MFIRKLRHCITLLLFLSLIAGCENRESYKKEIEQKGITYSRESFLNEAKTGNEEIIKLFIKAGIDINAKDKNGITALGFASAHGNVELARLLIEKGADVNIKDNNGITALLYLALHNGDLDVARLLIEKGANVN